MLFFWKVSLHSNDAYWPNDIALMNDDEYQSWLRRFRSVSKMALRAQLYSKQTKQDIDYWSCAFRVVKGDALKTLALNLKIRLSADELSIAFAEGDFPITFIKGDKSRVTLRHEIL